MGRKVIGSSEYFPAKAGKYKDSLTAEDVSNKHFCSKVFLFDCLCNWVGMSYAGSILQIEPAIQVGK